MLLRASPRGAARRVSRCVEPRLFGQPAKTRLLDAELRSECEREDTLNSFHGLCYVSGWLKSPATSSTRSSRWARDGFLVSARTFSPAANSCATTSRPTVPVAPVTRITSASPGNADRFPALPGLGPRLAGGPPRLAELSGRTFPFFRDKSAPTPRHARCTNRRRKLGGIPIRMSPGSRKST